MERRPLHTAIVFGSLSVALAPAPAAFGRDLSACALLRSADIARLTGWHVDAVRRKHYSFNGASGEMCFFEANQGAVIVIVPDRGAPFPGESPFTDQDSAGIVRRDAASGTQVTYYNGTAYMNVHRRDLAVRVVPESHIASYYEVEPFAEIVIPRVP